MKKIKKITFIGFILLNLIACGRKDIEEERKKAEQLQAEIRENVMTEIIDKYQIQFLWDTLYFHYSIHLKKVIESDYQLIEGFNIIDIYTIDNTSFIFIEVYSYQDIFFNLSIPKDQLEKIIDLTSINYASLIDAMVVKITNVRKIHYLIDNDLEEYIDIMGLNTYLNSFIGSGQVIEVINIK